MTVQFIAQDSALFRFSAEHLMISVTSVGASASLMSFFARRGDRRHSPCLIDTSSAPLAILALYIPPLYIVQCRRWVRVWKKEWGREGGRVAAWGGRRCD